jgi:glycogen debranching enzyme
MPDTWEFPWFAVWDTAFHAVALAGVDPAYAKRQLEIFTREWFMHPNGQLPAYEWEFNDVNPPVHAWATWRVYAHEKAVKGQGDAAFLERVFHKLLMNFTWWVNRKDADGDNVFQGGFLGMDNIGVFDWSAPLPVDGHIDQSDCTSWMAMYCLDMLRISWELASINPTYEDIASKFFEHFLYIASAIHDIGGKGASLWNEEDRFFYDQIHHRDGTRTPLRIRSMVGLIPLLAVEIVDHAEIDGLEGFRRRMDWFYENRQDLTCNITCAFGEGQKGRCLLSILSEDQLRKLLSVMLDEREFLSPYGIRSLSKSHAANPFVFEQDNYRSEVRYLPGESDSGLFGGNSNWRGPVWFPVNFLIIDALRRYDAFYGERLKVEFPTGSGVEHTLGEVAAALTRRLCALFEETGGIRPVFGSAAPFSEPLWQGKFWFHEYFHGDSGKGLGASHQTGWTALIANLLLECENSA